jgi:hypothetical protein
MRVPIRKHSGRGWAGASAAALVAVLGVAMASAQGPYLRGQGIQPVFEGWEKNADGTISLAFGYLNRNYAEAPHVPIGPNNFFSPGPQDQGQPTFFDPRRQSFVFKVTVPADWGNRDLAWSITHNGQTATAVGHLLPHWVLDEGVYRANRGSGLGGRSSDAIVNKPPSVRIVGSTTVTARPNEAVVLTAAATDDGLPGKRERRPAVVPLAPIAQAGLPTTGGPRSSSGSGTGGPTDQNIVQVSMTYETGLAVTWRQYRGGPAEAEFDPRATPVQADGKATTSVRFSKPGTYVIRAVADDSSFTANADVTVVVEAGDAREGRRTP